MACYHPTPALQDRPGGEVLRNPPLGTANLEIPCGNCLGCKTAHALAWARRAQHEASLWQHNTFITLTYDEEHLPYDNILQPEHLTKFFKRLRRRLDRPAPDLLWDHRTKPRYLAAGEYGERTLRPHYHALLFNLSFADKKRVGEDLYESNALRELWPLGQNRIGEVTGASANYVAQYTMKKISPGDLARFPNWNLDAVTGIVFNNDSVVVQQPFLRMSRKPPIGNGWLLKYKNDLQHGYLIHDARKEKIPRAIIKQLAKIDPQLAEQATYMANKHKRGEHDRIAAEIIHQRYKQLTAAPQL